MRLAFRATEREEHPVDFIEQIACKYDWSFERDAQDEISVCVEGKRANYRLAFSWMEEQEALHLACAFDLSMENARTAEMHRLLLAINEKLLLGHFDYWQGNNSVIYRQGLLLAGGVHPSHIQVETLLIYALKVCESHYVAFQMVAWRGESACKALQYTLFETVGNA
ncbi:YbjN domain-containing protein [Bartonella machadoae]|uniref:YbjN domain-containing protein n=1 Tax=Bartonella machadoae TaxID=2893471 RepID=UPI001F4CB104|nr:YbjN domain-containing protein [Bartonella machadoae]UNE55569.1 YbjN domain-containing protein [Bartonella machadoae]